MNKKHSAKAFLSLLLTAVLLFSVSAVPAYAADISLDSVTAFVFDGTSVTVKEGTSTNYEVLVIDKEENETDANETTDTDGNTVYSLPEDSDGILQVALKKKGGAYAFSGNGTGTIKVAKEGTADTTVYLNGLTLYSDFIGTIVANKNNSATVTVYAVEGTVNNLSDSVYNNDDVYSDNAVAEKAVIKAKAGTDLVICGKGTINIDGNGKNGIKAAAALSVSDVTLNIDVLDNGISGEETVTINSGNITIKSEEGDGIKCCAEETPEGDITINGGNFVIDALCDGIQATKNLTINGGTFDIVTYNGYNDKNYDGDDESFPSAKGLKASGSYIVTDENGNETEVDATGCLLKITGGTFNLNCADDAVHSDTNLTITSGSFVISSGDDAIHSEYVTTLGEDKADNSALTVKIDNCVEGIEGAKVNIYSGAITVFSTDDAINAANSELTSYTYEINVYGGDIYASAYNGDCFDSNKNITINGGKVIALGGIIASDNEALDCDGTLTINGGTVFTVQKGNGMSPSASKQTGVVWTDVGESSLGSASGFVSTGRPGMGGLADGSGFVSNGSVIIVYDSQGNELIKTVASWNQETDRKAGRVMFAGDLVSSGEAYTLSVDGNTESSSSGNNSGILQWFYNLFARIIEFFRNLFSFGRR